jgi:predicted RNA binding protein YcfA (HicA-like mRNA interferase family)
VAGIKKLLAKMKNQPNGMRFEEVAKVLGHHGYEEVRVKGSHHQFRNQDGDLTTVQYGNPVDKSYVKDILKRIGEEA